MNKTLRFLLAIVFVFMTFASATPVYAAITYTVDILADEDDGGCVVGDCSLREAIAAAVDGDTVDFDLTLPATITLGSSIVLQKSLTIDGPANGELTISGGDTTQLFVVFYDPISYSLSINDLTLADANHNGDGGAINSYGNLTIDNVRFENNNITVGNGAAVYMNTYVDLLSPLTLNVTNSVFDTNLGAGTGAIFSADSNVNIFNSSFSGNSNNAVSVSAVHKPIAFYIANSTFTNNSSSSFSGALGITSFNGANFVTAYIYNVTFAENTAPSGGSSLSYSNASNVTVKNTIFADNSGSSCQKFGIIAIQSGANNIATDATCNTAGITTTTKTLAEIGLETLVTAPTYYYPLSSSSAALEAGDTSTCADGATVNNLDQIGTIRPQAAICDIGSIEYTGIQLGPNFIVNTNADTNDSSCNMVDQGSGNLDCTLREAINAANALAGTDTITFADDYMITLDSSQLPAVTDTIIINGNGVGNTIIQANAAPNTASYRVFLVTTGNLTVNQMTVRHGVCDGSCASAGTVGGGIYVTSGSLTINDSLISANTSQDGGGGLYSNNGTVTITNSTFSDNSSTNSGGGITNNSTMTITNSTVTNNTATGDNYAGGIRNLGTLNIYNSTISGNTSNSSVFDGANIVQELGTLNLYNTIIANGVNDGDCGFQGGTINATNSLIESTGSLACNLTNGVNGNIIGSDPNLDLLTGSPAYLPLNAGSLAIDAGDDAICIADPVNNESQNGVTRPQGAHCDIGAYEFNPITHYVKWNAGGANDGTSWTDAYTDLQSAISAAFSGDEIWVAAGTYKPTTGIDRTISFALKNGVAIYGGFAGTETLLTQRNPETNVTILSGDIGGANDNSDNSYHVVTGGGTNNTAVLDGFTITKGNANDLFDPHAWGGGMHILEGSPRLANLVFTSNTAKSGGGIALDNSNSILLNVTFNGNSATVGGGGMLIIAGNPTLKNVTFNGNSALGGGGIANSNSNPTLVNVTFYGNMANNGGGMHTYGSPIMKNVTFSGNIASNVGGGLYNESSNPTIINSIFWNNTGGEIENFDGNTPNVSYSIVQGGYAGIGNLNADPLLGLIQDNGGFTQTMALGIGSPAIDVGDDANCPETDQRGVTRPQGSHCDIGAYEVPKILLNSTAINDGWILESSETSGKGGTKNNSATTLRLGDDAANKQYRSLLSFDTSSLPDDAIISSIILSVKRAGVAGGGNPVTKFGGFKVDIMNGNFGTLAALQAGDFKAAVPLPQSFGPFLTPLSAGLYSIDLTSASAFINLTGNTQMRLRFKKDDNNNFVANYLKLFSGNAAPADQPTLLIEYSDP